MSKEWSLGDILCISWTGLSWCVLFPLALRELRRYWQQRYDTFIQGRFPGLTIPILITLLFLNIKVFVAAKIISMVRISLELTCMVTVEFLLLLRCWHIYSKYQYLKFEANRLWLTEYTDVETPPFFIEKYDFVGNVGVTIRITTVVIILISSISITLDVFVGLFYARLVLLITTGVSGSILLLSMRKISQMRDLIYIREELFLGVLCMIVATVIYGLLFILHNFVREMNSLNLFFVTALPSLPYYGLFFVSSWWVLYQQRLMSQTIMVLPNVRDPRQSKDNIITIDTFSVSKNQVISTSTNSKNGKRMSRIELAINAISPSHSANKTVNGSASNNFLKLSFRPHEINFTSNIGMFDVLKDTDAFKAFMEHLLKFCFFLGAI
ncbi:hypothetical protein RFI_07128 [Reticulomyxa filosa]|uniref:Uncharacterized protein n=1 Tax=Reticulomyxa filosa TaxID=46433 RepID=X6NVF6_RETFI|nr:hypothetical protein RFI_07128 [Reticulomyxa filosa]|eukprot:ETO29991.1 hypothetical protein RFI_07128 [Reticulomyxa filosa]